MGRCPGEPNNGVEVRSTLPLHPVHELLGDVMSTIAPVPAEPTSPVEGLTAEPTTKARRVVIPALIMVLGMLVLLYPVVATQWNNWLQQRAAEQYEQEVMADDAEPDVSQAVVDAHRYNDTHPDGPILDPWLARISADNADYQEYLKQLSGLSAMSNVVIPSIDSSLPVYHGTSESTLQKGVGHLYGSSLPVGGAGTHAVLTGHTGLTNATLWDNLIDIQEGDPIYVSTFGERMKYEVHATEVVLPDDTDSLKAVPGEDLLTLITCTPYGINTHRLLVHAHRVPMDPAEAAVFDDLKFPIQWWMWVVLAIAAVSLVAMIRWLTRARKEQSDTAGSYTREPTRA